MKARCSFVLLFVVVVALLGVYAQPSSAAYATQSVLRPNMLVVLRTPVSDSGAVATISQAHLVQDIYLHILSLQTEPQYQVCPTYVIAQYQLTFLQNNLSLLKATARQGGCSTVTLGHSNIRAADPAFWLLLKRANAVSNGANGALTGLKPADLQDAYKLPSAIAGTGQTVAIVDAQDNPNAEADMAVYRSTFHLPACTTANGCFKKVDQKGGTHYPSTNQGWALEIALDLDMVSAICPNCHILLVEANSTSFDNLGRSVDTAVRLKATIISNSYGAAEDAKSAKAAAHYYNHPGTTITASAGDNGYGVQLPAAFKSVIAIGGTTLSRTSNTRGWAETVWSGTGSGCSKYVSKPEWQKDRGCTKRSVADVSAVADPNTGVAVYSAYGGNGWDIFGGTSASSPIIASIYALAGNATSMNGSYLYSHSANLNSVTEGNNGTCTPGYFCTAGIGYNGPTGLGTPNGISAF